MDDLFDWLDDFLDEFLNDLLDDFFLNCFRPGLFEKSFKQQNQVLGWIFLLGVFQHIPNVVLVWILRL